MTAPSAGRQPGSPVIPQRRIVGFHQDQEKHWVAELECGHSQHVRHTPPWQLRPWVLTEPGRSARIGTVLPCPACAEPERHAADPSQLAEQVRTALLNTALTAYNEAVMQGLCPEGAWEVAVSAMRQTTVPPARTDGRR
jgi:uncharacterized protein DUF3565